ncbi:hypothetical protein [Aliidiomarina indica]|uniref:hypothetical protein n=1 Tax=Aliidiomarina indica TaxID=2749147 RepID=UPI00188E6A30|nr:hypothetical protein [Aliidiomarina indica]
MTTEEFYLVLLDINSGFTPVRIESDEWVSRELISQLIADGYVSAKRQAPDNSVFINLSLTERGKRKLAELKRMNPRMAWTARLKPSKKDIKGFIYGFLSLAVVDGFFRLLWGN